MKKKIILTAIFCLTIFINGFSQQNYKIKIGDKPGQSGEIKNATITLKEIFDAKRITLNNDSIKISSFNISGNVDGFFKEIYLKTDSFSQDCYDIFPRLIGKKLYIENVKGINKNGKEIYIGTTAYTITE